MSLTFQGPIIQVGPSLYSINDQNYFERLSNLEACSYPIDPAAVISLHRSTMSNIFRNEHLIDICNDKLSAIFTNSAHTGDTINISNIIARYAYEVMFATTTGQFAGFLDVDADPAKVDRALKDWRFYAILYGSYLRYRPFIAAIRKLCGMDKIAEDERFKMVAGASDPAFTNIPSPIAPENVKAPATDIEARIALSLAGADPVVTLIFTSMQRMYKENGLLVRLREEISAADLSYPLSFEQLISRKDRLPITICMLLGCLRTHPGYDSHSYASAEGGISVGGTQVPAGVSHLLIPSDSASVHGNSCTSSSYSS
jgi:hypothetical protein